ncbi:MAG: hypothetical protein ACJATI_005475 [Halioglobus sp.]|jgi:hypothetical protein
MYVHAGVGTDDWATIDINFGNIDYDYNDFYFLTIADEQKQSELLSAVLYYLSNDVDNGVGDDIVDAMVVNAMVNLNNKTVKNQGEAAQILYAQALENGLSTEDLCKIINLFTIVYGDDFRDGIAAPDGQLKDYIIRDSYEGQPNWEYGSQGEDIGLEENTITTGFSSSPDIWNKVSSSAFGNKAHENPVYNGSNAANYLYVEVRVKDCEVVSSNEKLHVHVSESNISSVWPEDWTDKYYVDNNGVTTSIKIGYEITSSANNSLLDPGVDGIPMDQYVDFYTEDYTDPITNTAEVWKV